MIPNPFNLIPSWAWAVALAALLALCGLQTVRLANEQAAHAQTVAKFAGERTIAANALAKQTGVVLALERTLATTLAQQEKKDADNQKTVAGLTGQLRAERARTGGRMLDPNATACPATSAAVAPEPGPGRGPADAGQTGGLLSAELTELLLELTQSADEINIAYASCREDSLKLRAQDFQAR